MSRQAPKNPLPSRNGKGLLREDHSAIRLVPAADRDWWSGLSRGPRVRFAEKYRTKWTDEETQELIEADPTVDDYYVLGARMGRTPGSLRIRRSMMVHLLRDEYEHVAKAEAYEQDPKTNHKFADIAQVHRLLKKLGYYQKPVFEQFELARHLKQPSGSWRGDGTSHVARVRRVQADDLRTRLSAIRKKQGSRG